MLLLKATQADATERRSQLCVIEPFACASRTFSGEPVVEKAIGLCFHAIWEAMPGRERDSLEPFRHACLHILVLRFLDDGTHAIDGEEGIIFSRCEQKGTR